jgi:hypothetical protein
VSEGFVITGVHFDTLAQEYKLSDCFSVPQAIVFVALSTALPAGRYSPLQHTLGHKENAMRTTTKGLLLAFAMTLAACGGGAGMTATNTSVAIVECNPDDPATHDECGTVVIGLTDADGDFLNYTVDVLSIELETANGRTVETLPRRTRINFTDYVDLTEIVSARMIPPATYVAGTIRLDYANAEVFVEADGDSKEAVVTDMEGNPLGQTELRVRLSNRDQLRITKGRAALLQLDFDLDASHTVDIVPTPAEAPRPRARCSSSPRYHPSTRKTSACADSSGPSTSTR